MGTMTDVAQLVERLRGEADIHARRELVDMLREAAAALTELSEQDEIHWKTRRTLLKQVETLTREREKDKAIYEGLSDYILKLERELAEAHARHAKVVDNYNKACAEAERLEDELAEAREHEPCHNCGSKGWHARSLTSCTKCGGADPWAENRDLRATLERVREKAAEGAYNAEPGMKALTLREILREIGETDD